MPTPSMTSPARHDVEVVRDVRIPTAEPGVTLAADVYLPADAGPVPALVMALPYRKDAFAGLEEELSFRWLAKRGYACVLADFRGTGSSDGAMRPPSAADESDDGVALIEWAAAQPWCTGAVGMWGVSYGSLITMRTASRRPPALRAILGMVGPLDTERDFIHPQGARGAQAPIPYWGTLTLANQLLPPLHDFHDADEQRRWRRRVEQAEPWMLDLFRHRAGDPVWRERAVDASAIAVPSYFVAGWRDVQVEGQIRAYEEIEAPKKLLVGPWMHARPYQSAFEAIDFLPMTLRWWDHWLRGVENGVMDEPPVTIYVQGSLPGWRTYAAWPPPAHDRLVLRTGADTTLSDLSPVGSGTPAQVIGEYRPDPTIGSLAGLWSVAGDAVGLPLDQHDDDMRSLCATSEPLGEDLLIAGRGEVVVQLDEQSAAQARRLVVRLTDVDPVGRSTFIACGVVCPRDGASAQRVPIYPIAHRVPAGHRLRIALSDADFPRLWPLADAPVLRVTGLELIAPTVADAIGTAIEMPPVEQDPDEQSLGLWHEPLWQIARDPVHDGVEIVSGAAAATYTPGLAHRLDVRFECRARVRREAPQAAAIEARQRLAAQLRTGEEIEVAVITRLASAALWAHGEVSVDGTVVFSRSWDLQGPAEHV